MKEPVISLTKKDFVVQTFRAGGKGGQHQNKTDSAVRIQHPESGAVGECREHKSQHQNKKVAFERLTNSTKFKIWLSMKHMEVIKGESLEQKVDKMMSPENIKTEVVEDGEWTEE